MPIEGTWRSHQVPLADVRDNPEHLRLLEEWLRSYRPEELFDERRRARAGARRAAAPGERRMSANPHANGGELLRDLVLPDFRDYAVDVAQPGTTSSEATRVLGELLRDVIRATRRTSASSAPTRPRRTGFGACSRRPTRAGRRSSLPTDEHLAPEGRVIEVLSRAPVPGLARGLPAHRQARPLQLLRGVHPHRRLDVQPAREVAEGDARTSRGAARSRRSTTCSARTSGGRTTTASRTRIPASSTTS